MGVGGLSVQRPEGWGEGFAPPDRGNYRGPGENGLRRLQEARRGQAGEASGRQGPWAGPPAWGTLGGGSPVQGLDTCQDID